MRGKLLFLTILGIFTGGFLGFFTFLVLPYLPLPINSPLLSIVGIEKPRIIGFLPYFLTSRATNNYNPYITTLTYFGFTIGTDGHIVKLTNPQQEDPGWYDLQTAAVQKKLADAKNHAITLSLTVVQENEASISALLSDPKNHAYNLLSDVVTVMKKYVFTDLNIDIESFQNTDIKKQQQFITFVQTIKQSLQKQKLGTVTIDIPPINFVKQYLINPIKVGKIADYMLIMAYDYHTTLSSNTGGIAPLSGAGKETEYDVTTTIAIAKKEINPKKLIFGIPLYGYQWDSLNNTPGAATIPNTGQTASNRRIAMNTFVSSCKTCVIKEDVLAQEPDFIFKDNKDDQYFHQAFVFDTNAFTKRISFARSNNFAGVGLWALGYEGDTLLQPLVSYKRIYTFK